MLIPFITCVFPPFLALPEQLWVVELGVDGGILREGWIARPRPWLYPTLRDSEGAYYFTDTEGTNGNGLRVIRAELVGVDDSPVAAIFKEINLVLPTHLPSFVARIGSPLAVISQGQVSMVGCVGYSYSSPGGAVNVGVAFSDSSSGQISNSRNINQSPEWLNIWNASVEFSDGTFAAYDWGLPV